VTQNVTYDLQVGTSVDLSAGMTVSEGMRANYLRGDSNPARIVAYAKPESAAGEWVVRHVRSQEDPAPLPHALGARCGGRRQGSWQPTGTEATRSTPRSSAGALAGSPTPNLRHRDATPRLRLPPCHKLPSLATWRGHGCPAVVFGESTGESGVRRSRVRHEAGARRSGCVESQHTKPDHGAGGLPREESERTPVENCLCPLRSVGKHASTDARRTYRHRTLSPGKAAYSASAGSRERILPFQDRDKALPLIPRCVHDDAGNTQPATVRVEVQASPPATVGPKPLAHTRRRPKHGVRCAHPAGSVRKPTSFPGTCIGLGEPECSLQREVSRFVQPALPAVSVKPTYPVEVDYERAL
jgi:hypothetical protein